jgi:hypothetical protein
MIVNGIEYDYKVGDFVDFADLHWWSDWNGYEAGFPEVSVVGQYCFKDVPAINMYLNSENGEILEIWVEGEEDIE